MTIRRRTAWTAVLSSLAVASAGLLVATPASAIVGGVDAPAAYSFMGSLQRLDSPREDDLHVCGATLIAPTWAVTAGHCTRTSADVIDVPTSGHPQNWKVRFGSVDVDSGGELVDVDQFVQLNNRYFDRDLALLKLDRPVRGAPARLPEATPDAGTEVRIMGWGQTCHDSSDRCSPDLLQEADTSIQAPDSCDAPEGTLCVGPLDGGVGPENMDSGGPALTRDAEGDWTLVGSVEGAGADGPAIYTDIAANIDWIRAHVSGATPIPPDTPFPSEALAGTAMFSGCSGAIIRGPRSQPSDPAMLMTNGHCSNPRPGIGQASTGQNLNVPVLIKDAHGETQVRARATSLVYATMTGTDLALYRLDHTFQQLQDADVTVRSLSERGPQPGQVLNVLSAVSGRDWNCAVEATVPRLREGGYVQHDAIRYDTDEGCDTAEGTGPGHGDSGSPLVDPRTGDIVGIHATGNDDGLRCTENNPCEIDEDGNTTSTAGLRYGQQTAQLHQCLVTGSRIDLGQAGCMLTGPALPWWMGMVSEGVLMWVTAGAAAVLLVLGVIVAYRRRAKRPARMPAT